jgi:hypothetical protein
MSGVVLRCSNCGTVQAKSGECDACHEAQVRYFCTNHTPGLWLDADSCAQCGARWGEAVESAAAHRPDDPPVDRRPRWARNLGVGGPPGSERRSRAETPPEPDSFADAVPAAEREAEARRLFDLIAGAVRPRETSEARVHDADASPSRPASSGCLGRAASVAAVLIILPVALGGALLRLV